MCVFRRKYMYSAALAPDRPPARPPGRQPSPASPPGRRSASQRVPRASGIIVGNANEVLNRNMLRTDLSPAYIQLPRRNGRSPGRSAAALALASAGAGVPERRVKQFLKIAFSFAARAYTRPSPLASPIIRCFSIKFAHSRATCVISRWQQLSVAVPGARRRMRFPRKYK